VNRKPARTFYVAGKPVVELPRAGRLALWFQVTGRYGCSGWDSNLGSNYTFDIAR